MVRRDTISELQKILKLSFETFLKIIVKKIMQDAQNFLCFW